MSGLPAGWAVTEFENIADLKLGKMLDKVKNKGAPFRYLRNVNVRWGGFDLSDLLEMRFTDDELETFGIENGDLLICEGGEPGRSAVWRNGTTPIKFQKALHRVRFEEGFAPDFFAAELRHAAVSGSLDELFVGTTIKHLTRQVLASRQIPVPPLPEQRRIVAKLDALDARAKRARADLDRIPALVARAKQAILAKELEEIEAATNTVDLSSVLQDVRYGTAKKCEYGAGTTAVLRIPNIQAGVISLEDLKHADFEPSEHAKLSLRKGDLLIIRSNGSVDLVGRCAVVHEAASGLLFAGYLIRLRPDLTRTDPHFLAYCLRAPKTRQMITLMAKSTSGVNNINSEQIKSLPVPLPDLVEQQEIVHRIESAFQKIDRIAADAASASKLLGRLDQAILTKAFRGELVPQNPDDEPAGKLLNRVAAARAAAPRTTRTRKTRD